VTAAAARADIVVMMIHGGYEYVRRPSAQIKALSDAALAAGATMVIDHHPHVVGGLRFADGKLTAWTLGNLLFDQTVWPTFESYLLRVAVRGGKVVSAWLEPLRLQDFRPTGLVGADADWVAQGAFARSEGPWKLEDGSLWLDEAGKVRGASCDRSAGRDLLWTGDFEDRDLDPGGGVPLWNVAPGDPDRAALAAAAYRGARGVRLRRSGANEDDVLLTPLHRILVEPGQRLSFVLHHRAVQGPADGALQLSWYNDTKGGSQERSVLPLPRERDWTATRVDVRVPAGAVAVQPFIRLAPPDFSLAVMDVDDVRLIDRQEPGCGVPGGEALPPRATPLAQPEALPPGPEALGE
jgi:poly-gamma-glutamate synthesis protein (capsule biosynthesis protein)